MGCGGSTEDDEPVAPPPPQNNRNRLSPEEQAQRDADRKRRQEEEDKMCALVRQEIPPPFELGPAPNMSDEEAYKAYMRKKLEYQEYENAVLREAMKRIAAQA